MARSRAAGGPASVVVEPCKNNALPTARAELVEARTVFLISFAISLIFEIRNPLNSMTFSAFVFINSWSHSPFLFFKIAVKIQHI